MIDIPVWMPWVSADLPGGRLHTDQAAMSGLLTRARQGPLAFALTITDDEILEMTILEEPPSPAVLGQERVTPQQHLDYWLSKFHEAFNGSDANVTVRRQAKREVKYWSKEVRREQYQRAKQQRG